jgi:hypothetical protein
LKTVVLLLIFVVHVTSYSGRMLLPLFYIIAAAAAAACPIRIERERERSISNPCKDSYTRNYTTSSGVSLHCFKFVIYWLEPKCFVPIIGMHDNVSRLNSKRASWLCGCHARVVLDDSVYICDDNLSIHERYGREIE